MPLPFFNSTQTPPSPRPSRITSVRMTFSQLFAGTSIVGSPTPDVEESKAPRLGLRAIPPTNLDIPGHLTSEPASPVLFGAVRGGVPQIYGQHPVQIHYPGEPLHVNYDPLSPSAYSQPGQSPDLTTPISPYAPISATSSLYRSPTIPSPLHVNPQARNFPTGVSPEDDQLAELVHGEQRSQQQRRKKHHRRRHGPRKHHFCFPSVEHPSVRRKLWASFISGLALVILLSTYLSLALSSRASGRAFHVIFILIILLTTIFFCTSLIRLCMLSMSPSPTRSHRRHRRLSRHIGSPEDHHHSNNNVDPLLMTDEEAARGFAVDAEGNLVVEKDEEGVVMCPPPAYGLWRGSVRVDPEYLAWTRRARPEYQGHPAFRAEDRPATAATLPPGYEDGGMI